MSPESIDRGNMAKFIPAPPPRMLGKQTPLKPRSIMISETIADILYCDSFDTGLENSLDRILIKAKTLANDVKYPGALAQALKIPPMIAEKTLAQSKEYTLDELKKIYSELLLLDEKFKTTQNQERILFTQMINNL